MKFDPSLPWDTLLDRALQSWRDRASMLARDSFYKPDDVICDACRQDRYLELAILHDERASDGWPEWMRHELRENLIEIRHALSDTIFFQPLGDGTVAEYYRGSGLIPASRRSALMQQAVYLIEDHGKVIDLWLRERMTTLGEWPTRVRLAAERPILSVN